MANLFDDAVAAALQAPPAAPAAVDDDPPPLAVTVHGNVPVPVAAPAPSTAPANLFDDVVAASIAPRGAVVSPPSGAPVVPSAPVEGALPPPPSPGMEVPEAVAPGQTPIVPPQTSVAATGAVPPTTYVSPDDAVRALADGATFGLADKAAALANSALPDGRVLPLDAPIPVQPSYKDALAVERARTNLLPDNVKGAGQIGGGLLAAPLLAGAGMLESVNVLPKVGAAAAELAPKAGALVKALAGGIDGFRFGAANALGHHDGPLDQKAAHEAVAEGGIGAVVGGALPAIASTVGAGYGLLRPSVATGNPVYDKLSRATKALLGRGAKSSKLSEEALATDHPDRMLADDGNGMLGLLQGTTTDKLEGGAEAVDRLRARDAGRTARLSADVDAALGPDEAAEITAARIKAAREAAVDPHVAAGSNLPVEVPADLAARPSVKSAMNAAAELEAERGAPLGIEYRTASGDIVPSSLAEGFAAGSAKRMDDAHIRMFGNGRTLAERDAITKRRREEAAPFYKSGYADTIDYDQPDAGAKLLDLYPRFPESARRKAALIMQIEGDAPATAGGVADDLLTSAGRQDRPSSLGTFLDKTGGLAPTPDLKHMGVTGRFIRKSGMDMDSAREAAAEAGYLPHDSTPNDLLDLLDREARGEKQFPLGTSAPAKLNAAKEEADLEAFERARGDVVRAQFMREPDLSKIDGDAVDAAAHEIAFGKASEPLAAYDAARARTSEILKGAGGPVSRDDLRKMPPKFWDYLLRGTDSLIDGTRDPITRSVDTVGHALTGLRRETAEAFGEAVPNIKTARGIYADESRGLDALDLGRKAAAPGYTREQIERDIAPMSDQERDLYRTGFGNAQREKLANSSSSNLPHVVAGNAAAMEKYRLLAPSEKAFADFQAAIAGERTKFTESMAATPRSWMSAYDTLRKQALKTEAGDLRNERLRTADALKDALGSNPEFRQAIAKGEHFDKVAAAHELGAEAINGANATHPDVLAAQWSAMSPDEQRAVAQRLRSEVGRKVGTNPNDLAALKRATGGEGDYAGKNIRTIVGDEAADRLIGGVEREAGFAKTLAKVDANSESANRLVMTEAVKNATTPPAVDFKATGFGLLKGAAQLATRATYRLLVSAGTDNVRRELALALTETGARRAALVQGILRSGAAAERQVEQVTKVIGNPTLARSLVQAATPAIAERAGLRAKR